MAEAFDVLLIETEPYAGLHSATQLGSAGHHIHRCYPQRPGAGEEDGPAMCTALTGGTCPIDSGSIDVAVVAGPAASGHGALTAAGVTCALRHDIPLVADDSCHTSFGARLARRADGDVVRACERAAGRAFDLLRADILWRFGPVLLVEGLDSDAFDLRFSTDGPRLTVTVVGPPVERSVEQVFAVRVLDAVRAAGRVFGQVNVAYEPAT